MEIPTTALQILMREISEQLETLAEVTALAEQRQALPHYHLKLIRREASRALSLIVAAEKLARPRQTFELRQTPALKDKPQP